MPTKLTTKLGETEFYCVSCRKRVKADPDDMCVKIYKNKVATNGQSPALRAVCKHCETNLTKFVKRDDVEKLTKKYGKC